MSDWLADSRSLNKFQMIVFPPPPSTKSGKTSWTWGRGAHGKGIFCRLTCLWPRYVDEVHAISGGVHTLIGQGLKDLAIDEQSAWKLFDVHFVNHIWSYMYNIVLYLLIIYYTVYTSWLFGWAINRCHVVLIATLAVCRGESSRWCDFSGLREGYRYLHFRSLLKNHDYDSCWWRTIAYIPALLFKAWELVRKYFGRT